MPKYRGPRLRVVRRIGKLAAFTQKVLKRNTRPGQHGSNKSKPTQFGYRLTEKQKLLFYYGVSEKQLIKYIKVARKAKGSTGMILLQKLEMRLDNIIYRLGWVPTLPAARQLVNHSHVIVNQKPVTIPSFYCFPSNVITLQNKTGSRQLVEKNFHASTQDSPPHISLNVESITATVTQWVDRSKIALDLNELLIIEYYSNRLLINSFLDHFTNFDLPDNMKYII
jgi:small subunit ribosomal protein S4